MIHDDTIELLVQFGHTHSKSLRKAVRLASQFASYSRLESENGVTLHSVREPISAQRNEEELAILRQLCDICSGWKTTKIELSNHHSKSFRELFRELLFVRACQGWRESSPLNDLYCRGCSSPSESPLWFGCRFATAVTSKTRRQEDLYCHRSRIENTPTTPWWKFSSCNEDGTSFSIQKEHILLAVASEVSSHSCRTCRHFSLTRIKDDVASLPAEVIPSQENFFKSVKKDPPESGFRLALEQFQPVSVFTTSQNSTAMSPAISSQRQVPPKRLSDIALNESVRTELLDHILLPITHREHFDALGAKLSRGVLLHGPPGNGKTRLAECIAGEVGAHFELINGPEVLSKWLGDTEKEIRETFRRAKTLAPSILFIDEIDALAPSRSDNLQHHNNQIVAQLLTLLDDMDDIQMWVIGSTNRIDNIDPAIKRPGRFDRHIFIDNPSADCIELILSMHLDLTKVDGTVDIRKIADALIGKSGAAAAAVCNRVSQIAVRRAVNQAIPSSDLRISCSDFETALNELETKIS